jgi:hypothetical protein
MDESVTKFQKNLEFWILACYNVIVPGNDNTQKTCNATEKGISSAFIHCTEAMADYPRQYNKKTGDN